MLKEEENIKHWKTEKTEFVQLIKGKKKVVTNRNI